MNYKLLYLPLILLTIQSCSTIPDNVSVVPYTDHNESVGSCHYQPEALKITLKGAEVFCKKQDKQYVVIDTQHSYKGLLSEETNKKIDMATQVATALGQWIPSAGRSHTDHAYKVKFICK